MANSTGQQDFTQEPWEEYPWPGFDPVANDIDIGRHTLSPPRVKSNSATKYVWEAPVAVTKRGKVTDIIVKWAGYCPCFNSVADKILLVPADRQLLKAQLQIQGYASLRQLPNDEIVLLDEGFIANWRANFYAQNLQLEQWKSNRVRLDVGELRCSCPPAVRNHTVIPPFRSPQGWTVSPQPVAVPWEAFFWPDPDS